MKKLIFATSLLCVTGCEIDYYVRPAYIEQFSSICVNNSGIKDLSLAPAPEGRDKVRKIYCTDGAVFTIDWLTRDITNGSLNNG